MDNTDYTLLVPPPPDDLADWCRAQGKLLENYLIFKCGYAYDPLTDQREPCLDVVCSACGKHFKAARLEDIQSEPGCHAAYGGPGVRYRGQTCEGETIQSDKKAHCPHCHALCKGRHVGEIGHSVEHGTHVMVLSRVENNVVAAGYWVSRRIYKDGTSKVNVSEYEAYVFTPKRAVRLAGRFRNFYNTSFYGHWVQRKRFSDEWGPCEQIYPYPDDLLTGTHLENCKLDLFRKADKGGRGPHLVGYFFLFTKHPQVENLLVQGLGHLVAELVENSPYNRPDTSAINWRHKSPRKMLGLAKSDMAYVKKHKLTTHGITRARELAKEHPQYGFQKWAHLAEEFGYMLDDLLRALPQYPRLVDYLMKQQAKEKYTGTNIAYIDWKDYMDAAGALGYDLKDPAMVYPHRLRAAHDRAIKAREYAEDEKLRAHFAEQYERLQPLAWAAGGYLIRPAQSERDLIVEGKILSHCVGGYARMHLMGRPIFFIRKAKAPNTPFFTLQLDLKTKTILQNRGKKNCDPPEDVKAFAEQWQRDVVQAQAEAKPKPKRNPRKNPAA